MTPRSRTSSLLAVAGSIALCALAPATPPEMLTALAASPGRAAIMGDQSRAFIPNMGQWDGQAQLLAKAPGANVWVTDSGVVYDFHKFIPDVNGKGDPMDRRGVAAGRRKGHVVRMDFVGGRSSRVKGEGLLEGRHNYFLGNDQSRWASDVPRFSEARSEQVYDGVEARWYFDQGSPRYDLIVAPGADPSKIAMRFEGTNGIRSDRQSLKLDTSLGTVEHKGLFAYQQVDGKAKQVACEFKSTGNIARFEVGAYDRTKPLVIDPLVWSTFLGGDSNDYGYSVAVDSVGRSVVAGRTLSSNFPTTPGAYDEIRDGAHDAYVAKLSADGSTLLFATVLGGASDDQCWSVAIDSSDHIVICGDTRSTAFPSIPGSFDTTHNGSADAFVSKLSASGAALLYSTFVGGGGSESAKSLDLDSTGNVVVTGETSSDSAFPVSPGSFDTIHNGNTDAYAVKLSATGSTLLYGTYLGALGNDFGEAVTFDGSDCAIVVGYTLSTNGFPTTSGAFDVTHGGGKDGFAIKLSPDGDSVLFGTFVGGSNNDWPKSVDCDTFGNPVIAGLSDSTDLPVTSGSFDVSLNGFSDGFVIKLDSGGATALSGTYFGGFQTDEVWSVKLDSLDRVVVGGWTDSANIPVTADAIDVTHNGAFDAFIAMFSADFSTLEYGTYLGGSNYDGAFAISLLAGGKMIVAGDTASTNHPSTLGAYDQTHNSLIDAFVAKLELPSDVPIASPNTYTVVAGGVLSLLSPGILANDSGEQMSALLVASPSNASAFTLNPDGSFSYTPGAGFQGTDRFTYRATNAAGQSNVASVTLKVIGISGFTVTPATLIGGQSTEGTVTLGLAANGKYTVDGSSNSFALVMPSKIEIPNLTLSKAFAIETKPVNAAVNATARVSAGGIQKTLLITILPGGLKSLSLGKSEVLGGKGTNGLIFLTGNAPVGGTTVNLASNSAAVQVPATTIVPSGSNKKTFGVTTSAVSNTVNATITATLGVVSKTAPLKVTPPTLLNLQMSASQVRGGNNVLAKVILNGIAGPAGALVSLSATGPASIPSSVAIPQGQSFAWVTVSTLGVDSQVNATITATHLGVVKTQTVSVLRAALIEVRISSETTVGPSAVTARVILDGLAGPSGVVVTLASNNPLAALVPGSVTVAPQTQFKVFNVQAKSVAAPTLVTITGTYRIWTQTDTITVNP